MPIDEQIERVRDWVQHSGPALFCRSADIESEALWRTVRSADALAAPSHLRGQLGEANTVLGWFHHLRNQARRHPVDLAKAVLCLEVVADDHRRVPPALEALVGRFTDREEQARVGAELLAASLADAEQALLDAGIQLVAAVAWNHPARLSTLCLAYRRRHERVGSLDALARAIDTGEQAVELAPGGDTWTRLAGAYRCRYALNSDLRDLDRVVDLLDDAVRVEPGVSAALGAAYRLRYERTGDAQALATAVSHGERGAEPAELSVTLLRRFERDGAALDLLRAAELANIESTVEPSNVAGVVAVFLAKHEFGADPADLDHAVRAGQHALRTVRENHPFRPEILHLTAVALHRRYLTTGDEADLGKAAELADWAHNAFPPHQPGCAQSAMDLAAIRLTIHARSGARAELDSALGLAQSVVAEGCPPEWTATLGRAWHAHYLITRNSLELDRAIDLGERAVAGTAATDVGRPRRQLDLAIAYRTRYAADADLADLSRALELGMAAVRRTPADHIDLPWRLSVLAETHLDRYRVGRDRADLATAVELSDRAWRRIGAEHPRKPSVTTALAAVLLEQVDSGEQAAAADLLAALARDVVESRVAAPVDQVGGQHAVGVLLHAAGQADLAAQVLGSAVGLLPSLPPREAGWADRQRRVGDRVGLVAAAVAAHCAIGDASGAIEVAELGRGILLADEANTRVDLDDLRERQPLLAEKFEWVCDRLNEPDFPADERKRWWSTYEQLLAEIRSQRGFADFLAAPRAGQLHPVDGLAVLVNADRRRGHAVVIHADAQPSIVALPDLHGVDEVVRSLLNAAAAPLASGQLRRRRVVTHVLEWLWDAVVHPVIQALPPAGSPRRVWWVPTGPLGLLPLHAAGRLGQPGALDMLVSSFIPSLRALREARQRPAVGERRGLVVAMRHTSGLPDLPGAAAEAVSLPGRRLEDAGALGASVREALTGSTWAHFACHAVADPASPSDGGLLLHDGLLRLPEIGGLRLAGAELAYLSACSTANHGVRYADEVLHLASAFQLAGFRHVVATLWPVRDTSAAQAARAFYELLPAGPAVVEVATALNTVTRELRDSRPDAPELWAGLVHSGP
jgi:tetratricopeptide (TPR) repeat protein